MLLASLLILAQTDVLDVGVALTMDQRRVIHNARILLAEGNILAIGTQSEIPLPESVGFSRTTPPSNSRTRVAQRLQSERPTLV